MKTKRAFLAALATGLIAVGMALPASAQVFYTNPYLNPYTPYGYYSGYNPYVNYVNPYLYNRPSKFERNYYGYYDWRGVWHPGWGAVVRDVLNAVF